jgi:hypothetical protein
MEAISRRALVGADGLTGLTSLAGVTLLSLRERLYL